MPNTFLLYDDDDDDESAWYIIGVQVLLPCCANNGYNIHMHKFIILKQKSHACKNPCPFNFLNKLKYGWVGPKMSYYIIR